MVLGCACSDVTIATINYLFFDDYYIEYYVICEHVFVELSACMASRLVHEIEALFHAIWRYGP